MNRRTRNQLYAGVFCLMTAAPAWAQNTTPANAANLMVGQTIQTSMPAAASRFWRVGLVGGRSYCIETGLGEFFENVAAFGETSVSLLTANGATFIVGGDDAVPGEPGEIPGVFNDSRVCFRADASLNANFPAFGNFGTFLVQVFEFGGARNVMLRVVETTLFGPWFFIGGDYNAFTTMRNTINEAVNVRIVYRNTAGTQAGFLNTTVPAHGAAIVNARDRIGTADFFGTIEVSHNGSPEAIVANTTSLSATTGISFDTPLQQRRPW